MKNLFINYSVLFIFLLTAGTSAQADAQRGGFYRHEDRGGDFRRPAPIVPQGFYNRGYERGYGGYYGGGYRNVYAPPAVVYRGGGYAPYYGQRYYGIPRGSISLSFGGNPYYYSGGSYYRPYGGYYRSVFPPVGLQIGILPPGYQSFYMGPNPYYYYNGAYYRPYQNNGYQVVDAPMGAQLAELPAGAKPVHINGETFYELNGTYYKEDQNAKGNTVYTVAGKHGTINNTEPQNNDQPPAAPKVGDSVSELPAHTKIITLNGDTLYVAPDDTYYRAQGDGSYTVVGVAGASANQGTNNN